MNNKGGGHLSYTHFITQMSINKKVKGTYVFSKDFFR